jgi:hypothetical protein
MTRRAAGRGALPTRRFNWAVESALDVVRRNPVTAMLAAAAAGGLILHFSTRKARGPSWHDRMEEAEGIRVLNTGQARIYDPDASPLHPTQDSLESRREMSARI